MRLKLTTLANLFVFCHAFSQNSLPTNLKNEVQRLEPIYSIYYTTGVNSEYTSKSTFFKEVVLTKFLTLTSPEISGSRFMRFAYCISQVKVTD